jgi:hypothetical protein
MGIKNSENETEAWPKNGAQELLHGLLIHQDNLGDIGTDLVNIFLAAGIEPDCSNSPCMHSQE